MTSGAGSPTLPLRIDVDFRAGLLRAVPAMLDLLASRRMRATFLVVAGHNRPRDSVRRLFAANYRERLRRLGPWRVWSALRGDAVPMLEGEEARRIVRRIEDEGHELAVHGWDHAAWAGRVWQAPLGELTEDIDRAFEAIAAVAGPGARAWASPNWRTRDDVMAALATRGVPYLSECWGQAPFLSHGCVHLPVTDNLEPYVFNGETSPVAAMLDEPDRSTFRMICAHDYFEGLLHPHLFADLLDGLARRGLQGITLAETASRIDPASLQEVRVGAGRVEGFCGEVSLQSGTPSRVLSSATL